MTDKEGILIADSGSTKTAWIFVSNNRRENYLTEGANPFFRNTNELTDEWKSTSIGHLPSTIAEVYFYAAGVVNPERGMVIKKALQHFFPEAVIEVESDLLAAAHATLGRESGIACILGTGSNSCRYNGKAITAHVPPLGFILGDEGSGAVLGRLLIGDYLKKVMPEDLLDSFQNEYAYSYAEILNRVYRESKPNMFLAQFTPFIKRHIEHTYCEQLVEGAFESFIKRNVAQYDGYDNEKISFAGSIAYYFEAQLRKVLSKKNLHLGTIVKDPIEGLVNYHTQY